MRVQHDVNMGQLKLTELLQRQITRLAYIALIQSAVTVALATALIFH